MREAFSNQAIISEFYFITIIYVINFYIIIDWKVE